jgi:dienelactone hydrolase
LARALQILIAPLPRRRVPKRLAAALAAALIAACASSPPAPPAKPEVVPRAATASSGGGPADALAAPAAPAPAAPSAPPPPLDPNVLFAPPVVAEPSLSPDGRLIAWRLPEEPGAVRVRAVDGSGPGVAVPAAGEAGEVLALAWGAGGRRLWVVRRLADGDSLEAVELATANPSGSPSGEAAGAEATAEAAPARGLFRAAEGEVTLTAVVAGEPERALVGWRRPSADEHLLLAVSAAGGEPAELARGGREVERWLVDAGGEPRAAVLHGLDGSWRLAPVAGGRPGEPLLACTGDESCRALALHPDGRRLALATDHAGAPRVELAFLDLGDGGVERAGGVAGEGRDLGGALFAADGALLATWPAGEPFRIDPRSAAFAADWERLGEALPAGGVELVAASDDGRRLLAVADAAGAVVLLDLDRAEARELLRLRPGLDAGRAASRLPVRRVFHYVARDGLSIPAVLTLPPESEEAGTLPAVVLPPDDPWRPRRGGRQPLVELLADRGYAVLQPSPRGSAGFGRAFRAAGERQWGGAMVDDLADGVRWLVGEGIADPERVAIVGFGWGGYAAVASLAFTPDLYAAGIAVDGPVDLEAMVRDADDPVRAAVLRRRIGDPAVFEQRERLRRHSPLAHAGAIRAPLLRVDLEGGPWSDPDGSERLLEVLRGLGRPVEAFSVVEGSAVGGAAVDGAAVDGAVILEGAAGVAVAAEVERFLAHHLGSP